MGSSGAGARFRPARLSAAELPADIVCRFRCEGTFVGPATILDLSATGFSCAIASHVQLTPGSNLDSFTLSLGDRTMWSGDAVVVHGGDGRIGGRFVSGVLDLSHFRVEATLEGRLALLQEQVESLPSDWRAAVADLRQLLECIRAELETIEEDETRDPMHRGQQERELFSNLSARWGAAFYGAVARLHAMSEGFDERLGMLARSYATSMIMPLLMDCPLHRRAYEKPLGYAGDYRMMELFCADELSGDRPIGRFLHLIMQNYTLSRSVRMRQHVMRAAIRDALEAPGDGPVRILAVAAGPAIELRKLLEETSQLQRPLQLILLDQDAYAHEAAHRHLTRILIERHRGQLPVSVECLHFSVRQLLKPTTPEDHRVRDQLTDFDLIYSAGLYDYLPDLVAQRLTQLLFARVREGGRLLVGNMVETPDSTWMLDYVLGWPLLYRTSESMLRFADRLSPLPSSTKITPDATGRCVFLDVQKAALRPAHH